MTNNSPIGIFDSGIGGLSVMSNIHSLLPNESLSYIADSLYAPYGCMTTKSVIERSVTVTDFLINYQNCKIIVVACNTATANAIRELRRLYDIPIVGMEPAVKPASIATKLGRVGVLATSGTLESAKFSSLLDTYSGKVKFYTQACHGLVDLIERGDIGSKKNKAEIKVLLHSFLEPLVKNKIDTIVLGCTHYILIRDLIEGMIGPEIRVIDTGQAVAAEVKRKLLKYQLQSCDSEIKHSIWSNSSNPNIETIINCTAKYLQGQYKFYSNWP